MQIRPKLKLGKVEVDLNLLDISDLENWPLEIFNQIYLLI